MAPIENFRRDRRLFAGYSSEQDERSNSNAIIDVIRWRVWYLARAWLVTGSAALKRSQGDSLTCESRNPVLVRVGRRASSGKWLVRVRGWHSRVSGTATRLWHDYLKAQRKMPGTTTKDSSSTNLPSPISTIRARSRPRPKLCACPTST